MTTSNITLLVPYMTNNQIAGFLGLDPQAVSLALGDRPTPAPTLLLQTLQKVEDLIGAAKVATFTASDDPLLKRLCMKIADLREGGSRNRRINSRDVGLLHNDGYDYVWQIAVAPLRDLRGQHGNSETARGIKRLAAGYQRDHHNMDAYTAAENNFLMDMNDPRIQAAKLMTVGHL